MGGLTDQQIKAVLNKAKKVEDDINVSLDEIESFGNQESIATMCSSIAAYNKMIKERITFVNKELTQIIPFTRENLYLICAYTGSGKSTIAANISFPLWKEGKRTLVISNEESEQDVLFRIACIELGYNFNDYKKGVMPKATQVECMSLFPEIAKFVKIIDVNYKDGITTKVEGVKNILNSLIGSDFSCAMIDYYQLIKRSTTNPNAETYGVLNDFRIWLGQYIKRSNVPIVVFAQLHSMGKRPNKDIDSRIKDCPAIVEPSTVIIEVVPNFEERTSSFLILKDRFGASGKRIECAYDRGRFVSLDQEAIARLNQQKVDDIQKLTDIEEDEEGQP